MGDGLRVTVPKSSQGWAAVNPQGGYAMTSRSAKASGHAFMAPPWLACELAYWADPGHQQPSRINHYDGGRGVYWNDLDGHCLEIITRPYGSG